MCNTDETGAVSTQGCSTVGVLVSPEGEELSKPEVGGLGDPRAEHPSGEIYNISFTFGRIDEGDCTLYPSTLILKSNGDAEFHATGVASDNSGDVWLILGMALLDRAGVELYRIPQFNSPQLNLEDHNYPWDKTGLYFPEYLYPYIASVRMYHHC